MTPFASIPLQIVIAIGVPMLIALVAPLRWRIWLFLLWVLAPLLVLLAMAASEIATGRASVADLDKLVFGLLLIGSLLALPWLAVCGVGYAIGAMVRGKPHAARPVPDPVATPTESSAAVQHAVTSEREATEPLPSDPNAPTLSPPSGWHAAHVGFDHDDLMLDGLEVWALPWREERSERVMLAHPAHPGQLHSFTIYNVDDGQRATRFAAAELSNTVWGFYRWVVAADAPAGTSADGSLRYEHDLGPFVAQRYDAVAPVARLYDTASGALLFDGAHWRSSRVVPQADGSLLLSLEHGERQTIFRIAPSMGIFVDLAAPTGEQPLAELAEHAAVERAACDLPANLYLGRCIAPDGSMRVELQAVEWSNTHWVRSPRVIEVATGRVLLDLWRTDWDASVSFPRRKHVRLSFRRYHFGGGAEVEIDLAGERYRLFERGSRTEGPLSDMLAALEAACDRAAAEAGSRPLIPPARPTLRNWLVALVILAGTLALIAVATLVTLRLQGEPPPQKLDTIPTMPTFEPDRR